MRIEEATHTQDGSPIRIYATDGEANVPIHGAFWNGREWRLMGWNRKGEACCLDSSKNLDLHDWRDDIPWECLEDWIQWVALGYNGNWVGCISEPQIGQFGLLLALEEPTIIISGVKMPTPPDWQHSKVQRPEGK